MFASLRRSSTRAGWGGGVHTENLGSLVEERLSGGALLAELLGHAHGLSALAREEESLLRGVVGRLHHRPGPRGATNGLPVVKDQKIKKQDDGKFWFFVCGGGWRGRPEERKGEWMTDG